jgi:hypothetical protein
MKKEVKPRRLFLSRDRYLKALALYVMAADLYRQQEMFRGELNATLGLEKDDCGHVTDSIYDTGRTFEDALKLEGFKIPKLRR